MPAWLCSQILREEWLELREVSGLPCGRVDVFEVSNLPDELLLGQRHLPKIEEVLS